MKKGQKHSLATKKKMSRSRKKYLSNPENIEKISEAQKDVWKTKKRRDAHQRELERRRKDPAYGEKAGKSMSLAWERPEVRKKITDGVHRAYENKEVRDKIGKASIASWAVDEIRQSRTDGIVEYWSKEENRIRQSEKQMAAWEKSPERRVLYSELVSRLNRPELLDKKKAVLRSVADRSKMTNLERQLYRFLILNGVYCYEFTGARKKVAGNRTPDFVDEKRKMCIEMYGSGHKHTIDSDNDRIREIKDAGWNVLIVRENELKFQERLLKKILEFDES